MSVEAGVRWAVDALIASSILMAAVLLVRGHVRRLFGAQIAYALWALPLLRLLLPPIPQGWRDAAATPVSRATETLATIVTVDAPVFGPVPLAAVVPSASVMPSIGAIVAMLWLAGAGGFLVWHTLNHRRFCRAILGDADELGAQGGVRILASDAASGPVAFGVLSRYVAFPRDFAERWDADEQVLALDHELGHHARGDLLANWAALAVLAIHWFNPLAWRAFRSFRADQELANDARVLAGRSRADRHIYACAIVKAAHGGAVSAACHLHTIEDLKGRLKMLTTSRFSRRRLASGAATVATIGVLGLALTVSGSGASAAITERVSEGVAQIAAATPTAPPAASQPASAPAGGGMISTDRTAVTRDGKKADILVAKRGDASKPAVAANGTAVPPGLVNVNVTSGDCGIDPSAPRAFVIHRPGAGGDATVICTDRITAAAKQGQMTEADGDNIERQALTSALAGLRSSRASIAGMTGEARSEALSGIDESIKELESDLADVGKD